MQLEAKKYLYDIHQAGEKIARFTAGKTFTDYASDELLRAAVERQCEIIGEVWARLVKLDPAFAAYISEHPRIIAFRNILIHGYADVDGKVVWDVVETKLPRLRREVVEIMGRG